MWNQAQNNWGSGSLFDVVLEWILHIMLCNWILAIRIIINIFTINPWKILWMVILIYFLHEKFFYRKNFNMWINHKIYRSKRLTTSCEFIWKRSLLNNLLAMYIFLCTCSQIFRMILNEWKQNWEIFLFIFFLQ